MTHILISIYLVPSFLVTQPLPPTPTPLILRRSLSLFVFSFCTGRCTPYGLFGTYIFQRSDVCCKRQYPGAIFLVVFRIFFCSRYCCCCFWASQRSEMMNTDNVSKGYVALMVKRLGYYIVDSYNVECGYSLPRDV